MPFTQTLRFAKVEKKIRSGDLMLWCGRGFFSASAIIARATCSHFTHAGMVDVQEGSARILEMTFKGGMSNHLQTEVVDTPGQWEWRPIRSEFRRSFDGEGAAAVMRQLCRQAYGKSELFWVALKYIPGLRVMIGGNYDDDDVDPTILEKLSLDNLETLLSRRLFCSEAVALASALGGGVDPVQRVSHKFTAPVDISHSLLWDADAGAILIP